MDKACRGGLDVVGDDVLVEGGDGDEVRAGVRLLDKAEGGGWRHRIHCILNIMTCDPI